MTDPPTHWLTGVKCRATSVAKNANSVQRKFKLKSQYPGFVVPLEMFFLKNINICVLFLWSASLVADVKQQIAISPAGCATTSGPDPNKMCKFPFVFRGITWTGCTIVDEPSYQLWCATETDSRNYPVTSDGNLFSTWGYCKSDCLSNQGLTFLILFFLELQIFPT